MASVEDTAEKNCKASLINWCSAKHVYCLASKKITNGDCEERH